MTVWLLDSSALLTLRDDEPGAQRVTELLAVTAEIKAKYRVSLADAWIAASTLLQGAVLIHKDPEFTARPVRQEALPFKETA